jgi:hypothetical protein
MRLRVLGRRVAGILAALLLVACIAWLAGGVEPYGPIGGGRLRGERADSLPEDWSFVDRVGEVQVETAWGRLPWSVTTWCLSHQGRLYLPARNCLAKRWVKNVLADPDVRVRIQGRVYPLRAIREEDPQVQQALIDQMLIKYLGIEAERPQPVADVTPEAEGRAYGCAFRMEPRP